MSLDDIRLRETVDLGARVTELRDDLIPDVEQRIESDDDEHDPDELRDLKERLEGQAKSCERVIDALGGGEFVIQELMAAETAKLTDDVSERSIDVDYDRQQVSGTPKQGYHKIRTLELSIVDAPEGADEWSLDKELGRETFAVGKLPDHVSDYLYQCVIALNDAGEVDGVGNLSDYGVGSGES